MSSLVHGCEIERLLRFVEPDTNGGCWLWSGSSLPAGYGKTSVGRKHMLAHRAAWVAANGREIPDGMIVRHKCDVRACVNPDHLELGTHSDNVADCLSRGRFVPLKRKPVMTAEQLATIVKRKGEGWSDGRIAAEIKVARQAVGRAYRRVTQQQGEAR